MLVFKERGKPEYPDKNLSEQSTNDKLKPYMTPGPGIKPGTHWWEASAVTTAPALLAGLVKSKKLTAIERRKEGASEGVKVNVLPTLRK